MSGIPAPSSRLPMAARASRLVTPRAGLSAAKRKTSPEPAPTQKRTRMTRRSISMSSLEISNLSKRAGVQTKPSLKPIMECRAPLQSRSTNIRGQRPTIKTSRPNPISKRPQPPTVSAAKDNKAATVVNKGNKSAGLPGKKRAAWDLKGRLADLEEAYSNQRSKLHNTTQQADQFCSQVNEKDSELKALEGDVTRLRSRLNEREDEVSSLDRRRRDLETELDEQRQKHATQLQQIRDDHAAIKERLETTEKRLRNQLEITEAEVQGLRVSVAQLTSEQTAVRAQLTSTESLLETEKRHNSQLTTDLQQARDLISRYEKQLQDAEIREQHHDELRKQLHNTIQELKGNIRVFCRVRPFLSDERSPSDSLTHSCFTFPDIENKSIHINKPGETALDESGGKEYQFDFDRVFQPEDDQATVFEEISQLVQSALDGYNVCVFAYGQTGSGKTYTMEGGMDSDVRGMIPRSMQQVFHTAEQLAKKNWQFEFQASILEIYNETIRDLLSSTNEKNIKHDIKMTGAKSNDVFVTNLTVQTINSTDEALRLLRIAASNRAVAATNCNERSSRSHSVMQLKISGKNSQTQSSVQSVLSLVDLAGSERLKESGSTGNRLKETLNINQSLSTLGNVILALGNKEKHVPYRNSKLTYLLQSSLGGNSKTLMFVNVSPREDCFSETINSLRFATKVNQCSIGTATKRVKK